MSNNHVVRFVPRQIDEKTHKPIPGTEAARVDAERNSSRSTDVDGNKVEGDKMISSSPPFNENSPASIRGNVSHRIPNPNNVVKDSWVNPALSQVLASQVDGSSLGNRNASTNNPQQPSVPISSQRMSWMSDDSSHPPPVVPKYPNPVQSAPKEELVVTESTSSNFLVPEKQQLQSGDSISSNVPAWKLKMMEKSKQKEQQVVAAAGDSSGVSQPTPLTISEPLKYDVSEVKASKSEPQLRAELNKAHASLLRAQMSNNSSREAQIKKQMNELEAELSSLQSSKEVHSEVSSVSVASEKRQRPDDQDTGNDRNVKKSVILPIDSQGRLLAPLLDRSADLVRKDEKKGSYRGKVDPKWSMTDIPGSSSDGVVINDYQASINELLRSERSSGPSLDSVLARNISQTRNSASLGALNMGADLSGRNEDFVQNSSDSALLGRQLADSGDKLTAREQQRRALESARAADRAHANTLEHCHYCIGSKKFRADKLCAAGISILLMKPIGGSRLPGHLQLVPRRHIGCLTSSEDDEYAELNRFKGTLASFFKSKGEDVLFLECAILGNKGGGEAATRAHCVIDVVPLDKELAFDAPIFFRKAMEEAEDVTTNRSVIDTAGVGLKKSIPAGFSYFHVSWRGGGLVHPIENESKFNRSFGMDIVAGMMGLDPAGFGKGRRDMNRSGESAALEAKEREDMEVFIKEFQPFNFTVNN